MANDITAYNPTIYAQKALINFEKALGMGRLIYTDLDLERRAAGVGQTVQYRKPMPMEVTAGGTSTAQDLEPTYGSISLDYHRQVRFGLTDKEGAFTGDQIIEDHIRNGIYAIANELDENLIALGKSVPWSYDGAATATYNDMLGTRKVLIDNGGSVIKNETVYFAIDTDVEKAFLGLDDWKRIDAYDGRDGLIKGMLNERAGVMPFLSQNLYSHTSGTVVSAGVDNVGALSAAASKGDTIIAIDGLSLAETIVIGDSFNIAGHSQRYVATANTTLSTGAGNVSFSPPLVTDYLEDDVVTFEADSETVHAGSYYSNLMFHRNAFAIVYASLPETGNGIGANMATVQDPRTGISIRSRIAYDDASASVKLTLDILYGIKCIDPNLAVIYRRNKP